MRIPLDQIHESGMQVTGSPAELWVKKATKSVRGTPGEPTQDPHEEEGAESASVNLVCVRRMDRVEVSGDLEMKLRCACDRCGESVLLTIKGQVDQVYKPPELGGYEADHDLVSSEMNVGWHDGQAIDLEVVLTEALAMLGPDRVRCEDEGVERIGEEGPCELPASALEGGPSRPNPFAALKLT